MAWIAAAIVLVASLAIFPRALGYTLSGAVALGLGLAGFLWWQSSADDAASAKVQPTIQYDVTRCKPGYPIYVGFVNNSDRTVKSINFSVTLRRKGYSGEIGSLSSLNYDKTLNPGESFWLCYAMPVTRGDANPSEIEFDVLYKYVTWQ